MKILFVMSDDGDMTEPMNLMLLSALAKEQGHVTSILVLERDDIRDSLRRFRPDIAAFSCVTGNQRTYIRAATEIRRLCPQVITVFGGPHFTYFPDEILRHPAVIDVTCIGEGDDAWPELLKAFVNNRSYDDIPNIITQNNAASALETSPESLKYRIRRGFVRPRKTDLDSLPFLDRGLVYDNTAFQTRFKRTHMASRGCPFRCSYCFEPQFNDLYKGLGRIRQYYSVDRFLDELEFIKKNWDTRYIKLYDDVFIPFPNPAEIAWHEEFCSKYPKRIGLPFHLLTRCDVVMALRRRNGINVIRDWKKAGLASLTMSIESGNRFIHDHVLARDMSMEDIKDAFALARSEGVYTFPNTILAVPTPLIPREDDSQFNEKLERVEQELHMLRTVNRSRADLGDMTKLVNAWLPNEKQDIRKRKYIISLLRIFGLRHDNLSYDFESVIFTLRRHPGFAEFVSLFPYPGTRANDWCIARGDFDGDFEKLHASYQTKTPLACFDAYEKDIIHNLTTVGTFLTLFWGSRNRLINLLARPMTRLFLGYLCYVTHPLAQKIFLWLYTVSKAYMHRTRMYPIQYTFREKLRFYAEMMRLDFWKKEKIRITTAPKNQDRKLTLGGPF